MNNYGITNEVPCCPASTRTLVDMLKEQEFVLQEIMCNVKCIHDCLIGDTLICEPHEMPKQRTIISDVAETNFKLVALEKAINEIRCALGVDCE